MPDPLSRSTAGPMPTAHPPSTNGAATASTTGAAVAVPEHRHIFIVTGPAGCGKTTVAEYLSKSLSLPYLEGDAVSSPLLGYDSLVHCNHSKQPHVHT